MAIALTMRHAMGVKRVGIFYADFHGSSIPTLMNLEGCGGELEATRSNYGVECMSIEFCTSKASSAVSWRGLMLTKAVGELWKSTQWKNGPLDLLVVDLPPGTGDVHMTIERVLKGVSSLVSVSMPSKVAMRSAKKGLEMFELMGGENILGAVYNMVHWECVKCGALNGGGGKEN